MGRIKPLLLFMFLILIHEAGHFLTACFLGWKTDKICLYPYGGISKFDTLINVSMKEEFFVLIMGPILQIVGYFVLKTFIGVRSREILTQYHYFLLFFNLLPIYPLDGGKLANLMLCIFFSYRRSFQLIILFSYLTVGILSVCFFIDHSLFFLIVLVLFIHKIRHENNLFPFAYQMFLMERCMYNWHYLKNKVVRHEHSMKRDTYHIFQIHGNYVREEVYLKKILKFHFLFYFFYSIM